MVRQGSWHEHETIVEEPVKMVSGHVLSQGNVCYSSREVKNGSWHENEDDWQNT